MAKENWILTYTGKMVSLTDPQPEDICVADIAHALSMLCRYTGHTTSFYSVAEHSIVVWRLLCVNRANPSRLQQLGALLHDAHEAYIGDLSRPLGRVLGGDLRILKLRFDSVIGAKFGVDLQDQLVKQIDTSAISLEAREVFVSLPSEWYHKHPTPDVAIDFLPPASAETMFLEIFHYLTSNDGLNRRYA